MKNNNSRSNEMPAFNVLLSSMSFVEDERDVLKRNIIKVETRWS